MIYLPVLVVKYKKLMNFSRLLNYILFLTTTLTITLFLTLQAQAAAPFDATMCNITNIVTGNAGKAFAAFAVISLGVGFFSGKISLGLLVASSIGISSIFAAPSMVSLLSGKDAYECEEGATYVVDCGVDGVCYSCPAGHVGADCSCPVGFAGKVCSECDVGYSPIDGTCKLDCTLPTIEGITDTTVQNGTGILACNTDSNYTGSINYSCNNNNFSIASGSCACIGNHAGTGCASCADGYRGADCDECNVDYTQLADGSCAKDCHVSGKLGITDGTLALPTSGSLACVVPYSGNVNYSCLNGEFSSESCEPPVICSGGDESTISVFGIIYKIHKFTLVGSYNFSCDRNKTVEVLVVAGGGSGGAGYIGGGGGGAGGVVYNASYSIISENSYIVAVGKGGEGVNYSIDGKNGDNSSFGTIIAYGGGGGGSSNGTRNGLAGGSGGGDGRDMPSGIGGAVIAGIGGTSYGNVGGGGANIGWGAAGGGGGAGGVGTKGFGDNTPINEKGGDGGVGIFNSITGAPLEYAGGGGGATQGSTNVGIGKSGGGNGSNQDGTATSGINKTGSGGGGSFNGTSGSGGSGIVIVRYVN